MIELTQKEFEDNFDAYMDRVENNKEVFLIRLPDGRGVVMAPVEDNLIDENYVPEITDWNSKRCCE